MLQVVVENFALELVYNHFFSGLNVASEVNSLYSVCHVGNDYVETALM